LTHRGPIAGFDDRDHPLAYIVDRDTKVVEHSRRNTTLLANQPQEQVLGADVVVPERPRLVLREDGDLARSFSEPLEHEARA
jgi:hypothetical protein